MNIMYRATLHMESLPCKDETYVSAIIQYKQNCET